MALVSAGVWLEDDSPLPPTHLSPARLSRHRADLTPHLGLVLRDPVTQMHWEGVQVYPPRPAYLISRPQHEPHTDDPPPVVAGMVVMPPALDQQTYRPLVVPAWPRAVDAVPGPLLDDVAVQLRHEGAQTFPPRQSPRPALPAEQGEPGEWRLTVAWEGASARPVPAPVSHARPDQPPPRYGVISDAAQEVMPWQDQSGLPPRPAPLSSPGRQVPEWVSPAGEPSVLPMLSAWAALGAMQTPPLSRIMAPLGIGALVAGEVAPDGIPTRLPVEAPPARPLPAAVFTPGMPLEATGETVRRIFLALPEDAPPGWSQWSASAVSQGGDADDVPPWPPVIPLTVPGPYWVAAAALWVAGAVAAQVVVE